jgi:hypothetical protein
LAPLSFITAQTISHTLLHSAYNTPLFECFLKIYSTRRPIYNLLSECPSIDITLGHSNSIGV